MTSSTEMNDYDVIIVGAGISGISAAYHLQKHCPGKTYRILEQRQNLGGTWDLFNYPGIRSDSDMYTFGFSFRPWKDANSHVIAEKHKILDYLHDTVKEYSMEENMEFGIRIEQANFDTDKARWTLVASKDTKEGKLEKVEYRSQFLFLCVGYYNYDEGYTPDFPGMDQFQGKIVHPQHWPRDLDYKDKKVVVIGSGATAVTLIPNMARKGGASHITMLQRSPTYIVASPAQMGIIPRVLAFCFGHAVTRWYFVLAGMYGYLVCKFFPAAAKKNIIKRAKEHVGEDIFDDKDFTPRYNPWEQRLCVCPDGDFFKVLKSGKASIVTDHIVEFAKTGIRLQDAQEELKADIIVTATGLKLQFAGGIKIQVDGQELVANQKFVYKGFMASDAPNIFLACGYTNASWTLKVDLTNKCACRLMQHMDAHGYRYCMPKIPASESKMEQRPILDLTSGYIQRRIHEWPKQSSHLPWRLFQNYIFDKYVLEYTAVEDGSMAFYT